MHLTALACVLALIAPPAMAERGHSGNVYLKGLARDVWPDSGLWRAMVCNVNGPDGFLSVCAGAGTNFEVVRSFNRLAVLNLDLSQRRGRWVRVTGATAMSRSRAIQLHGATCPCGAGCMTGICALMCPDLF